MSALVVIPALIICITAFLKSPRSVANEIQLSIYVIGMSIVMSPLLTTVFSAALFATFINILMLAIVIALIVHGYRERQAVAINVAVLSFVVQVACRYVELFWGQIPPEVFFTILGLMLLLGGMFLERGRKRLLQGMRDGLSPKEVS
jgi:uncharacterized membrane protein